MKSKMVQTIVQSLLDHGSWGPQCTFSGRGKNRGPKTRRKNGSVFFVDFVPLLSGSAAAAASAPCFWLPMLVAGCGWATRQA